MSDTPNHHYNRRNNPPMQTNHHGIHHASSATLYETTAVIRLVERRERDSFADYTAIYLRTTDEAERLLRLTAAALVDLTGLAPVERRERDDEKAARIVAAALAEAAK